MRAHCPRRKATGDERGVPSLKVLGAEFGEPDLAKVRDDLLLGEITIALDRLWSSTERAKGSSAMVCLSDPASVVGGT